MSEQELCQIGSWLDSGTDCEYGCRISNEGHHLRNSESLFQRWSVILTQRVIALSEVHVLAGVQSGEQPPNQLNKWRILRDIADMDALTHSLESLCDPFSTDYQNSELVNLSPGKVANKETKIYFLLRLERSELDRINFAVEFAADQSRFLKTVPTKKGYKLCC